MNNLRIILVDDKLAYRNATKVMLNKIGNNEVVGEASNGTEFLNLIETTRADIVFIDIEMPMMNGIEATRAALKKYPELIIIGLSLYDDKNYISQLIEVGARGYLLKLSDNYTVLETILKYPRAEIFFSKEIDLGKITQKSKEKTILVVDDFANTRFIIEFTLQKDGYKVVQAASGEEALMQLENTKFDLIITDLNMPGMDGITLVHKIKSNAAFLTIPIILLTTAQDQASRDLAKAAGITGWINKPFEVGSFLSVIRKILK